jgi:hypothetical protein
MPRTRPIRTDTPVGTKMNADTFWTYVRTATNDQCWEWGGGTSGGYGMCAWEGKTRRAHRVAAMLCGLVQSADAPKNKLDTGFIMHTCDNRKCCNPNHMQVGTYAENNKDALGKGRHRAGTNRQRLSAAQLTAVHQLFVAGVSVAALARRFDRSERTILRLTTNVKRPRLHP